VAEVLMSQVFRHLIPGGWNNHGKIVCWTSGTIKFATREARMTILRQANITQGCLTLNPFQQMEKLIPVSELGLQREEAALWLRRRV